MTNSIHTPNPVVSTSHVEMDLLRPTKEMIYFEDIAQALSRKGRYCDQSPVRITVAQHVALCDWICETDDAMANIDSLYFRSYVIFHDAHEAYTGDISRPLKRLLDADGLVSDLEERIDAAIFERVGIPHALRGEGHPARAAMKMLDNLALSAEVHVCFPEALSRWNGLPPANPDHMHSLREILKFEDRDIERSLLRRMNEMATFIENEPPQPTRKSTPDLKTVH